MKLYSCILASFFIISYHVETVENALVSRKINIFYHLLYFSIILKYCVSAYKMRTLYAIHEGQICFCPFYFIPNNLPSFALLPLLVVGMPVAFATFLFALVTPNARFQLKDKPGIPFFFAIFPFSFALLL